MRPIPEFLPSHEALDVSRLRSAKRPYAELVWKAVETGKIDEPTFGSLATFVRMPYDIEDHPEAERLFLDIVGEFGTLPEGRPPVSDEEADFLRTMSEWTIVQATTKERSEGIRAKVLQTLEPDLKAVMDTVHL
ncbi:MAG: hypothetical protein QG650_299 [Patescibacteria group bacterium]|nr:hypothetical protein [Patescibacteria group bacterium]